MHSFSVTEAWWKNRFFELNDGLCIELGITTKNVINFMIIIKLTIEEKKLTLPALALESLYKGMSDMRLFRVKSRGPLF